MSELLLQVDEFDLSKLPELDLDKIEWIDDITYYDGPIIGIIKYDNDLCLHWWVAGDRIYIVLKLSPEELESVKKKLEDPKMGYKDFKFKESSAIGWYKN